MKNLLTLFSALLLTITTAIWAHSTTVTEEFDRVSGEVAGLRLGFGDYHLGARLTDNQKAIAAKNPAEKTVKGTYKFKDGEVFVIASSVGDTVLGLYKEYPETTLITMKSVIATLMLEHGEPTAIAHDKLVYWSYDKNGKIDQDLFDFQRQNGGVKSLAAVKFSSSEPIVIEAENNEATAKEKQISAYVMITSDPMSKLFLVQNPQETQ